MATLTVTAKGQITLKQELLRHLNVAPGQKVEVDKLPDGRLTVRPAQKREMCIRDRSYHTLHDLLSIVAEVDWEREIAL